MNTDTRKKLKKEVFSLKDFLAQCKNRWPWFVASLILFTGLALVYWKTSMPKYELSEEVLIQTSDGGASINDVSGVFSSLGFGSANTDVYNEIIALNSPAVMLEVINRLNLRMEYTTRKGLTPSTLYGRTLPFFMETPDLDSLRAAKLTVTLSPDGRVTLSKFGIYTPDGLKKLKGTVDAKSLDDELETPLGKIILTKNPAFDQATLKEETKIKVTRYGIQSALEKYTSEIHADLVDQDADVIGITIKDANIERAKDILNSLLDVYSRQYISDKNKIAVATSGFIDERLHLLQRELGDVDDEISDYKTGIGTPDLMASTTIDLQSGAELDAGILEMHNRVSMIRYMEQYLEDPANKHSIIPVNIGLGNEAIARQVEDYNRGMLKRNSLASNSSDSNPIVRDLDTELSDKRAAIKAAVRNDLQVAEKSLRQSQRQQSQNRGKVRNAPGQENHLRKALRQQAVKENLYIFLLQKREENQLSQKFTTDNLRIITPPMGSDEPVSPRKYILLALGIIAGLALPMVWVYLAMANDTKLHSRKDLGNLDIPFTGEIPQCGKSSKFKSKTGKGTKERPPHIVVEEGNRDAVNEAFRVIRNNIDFMARDKEKSKTVMITSFNPGSGKSFTACNLAAAMSIKKKNVLLVDCDLRHASTSLLVGKPGQGLSDWLSGKATDWKNLLRHPGNAPSVDILPVGTIPPNPAELLEEDRFSELIRAARTCYDAVILDCPPIDIVADSLIIAPHADSTVFVLRAGLFEKESLEELDNHYRQNRYPRMSVILNGTVSREAGYYNQ